MTSPYSLVSKNTLPQNHQLLVDSPLDVSNSPTRNFTITDNTLPSLNTPNFDTLSVSPPPIFFTEEDIFYGRNRLTAKSKVNGIVNHKWDAIIEFPLTGSQPGMAIAHYFPVNPGDYIHPKYNVQYSLGGSHGGHEVLCHLLRNKETGEPVLCKQTRYNCMISCQPLCSLLDLSLGCNSKSCSFNPTHQATPFKATVYDSWGEVFMKTLSFFCALQEHGCAFSISSHEIPECDPETSGNEDSAHLICIYKDTRSPLKKSVRAVCKGRLILEMDKRGCFLIR